MKVSRFLTLCSIALLTVEPRLSILFAEEQKPDASQQKDEIRKTAETVLTVIRAERVSGLPSPKLMKSLSPLFTPELTHVIEVARKIQEEQIRRHPDEKPPWIEGDLFGSLFEGVTTWKIEKIHLVPGADAQVKVDNKYQENGLDKVEWTDTWLFKPAGDSWLLDDIRMGGDWAFSGGASLRSQLPGGGKEEQDHLSPDGKWNLYFEREDDAVKSVVVSPLEGEPDGVLLYGKAEDEYCPLPTWVVWSPNCDYLALHLGDGPRYSRTRVFRLGADGWEAIKLPEFFPNERKQFDDEGFHERHRRIEAEYWRDDQTLVVLFFGLFTKGDEGDEIYKYVSVRFEVDSKAKVVDSVEVNGEE